MSSASGSSSDRSEKTLRRSFRGLPRVNPGCRAFSLVEVVIAIAIFAFAIVGLLSLLTVAARSARYADVQAAQATIVSTIDGKFSSAPFASMVAALPATYYFNAEGTATNTVASSSTSPLSSIYQCVVTDVSSAATPTTYMRQVQLTIRWPTPAYTQTNIVVASFAKYD